MPGLPPKLVVTTYTPARRWIAIVLLLLIVGGGIYGMFEYGRYRAGYDVVTSLEHRARDRKTIGDLESTISELRAKVAQLESSTVGQTREREEVQRTIGDLQAQVARANAYRGDGHYEQVPRPRHAGPAHEAGFRGERRGRSFGGR
jgi:hypothetical protein